MANENLDFMGGKDLFLNQAAVRKLIELILSDVKAAIPGIANAIPGTEEEANQDETKGKLPTVLAVFNALKSIDHIKFRVIKGQPGQTFDDAMKGKDPEEVALYFYRTGNEGNFDLYIYDSTQGKYFPVGKDSISEGDLGLGDKYWSKEDLDITAFWKKEDFDIADYVKRDELEDLIAGQIDLTGYLKKDDIGTMTTEQVEAIFNAVKNGTEFPAAKAPTAPSVDTAGGQAGGWEE